MEMSDYYNLYNIPNVEGKEDNKKLNGNQF